ncbi:hypothetical protein [uncultured Brevibacillus sp.]|uniref:hypothetical protein n=1 Tax=uncultured Brevibacillus sp. TaxID=169970 RepID=UPI0025932840|nr:hypothetical protein [uncultured Brevibacillus sp.]
MLLRKGVTGIFPQAETILEPLESLHFKRMCHSVFKNVISFDIEISNKNFYVARLDSDLYALLNAYYPLLAFANAVAPFTITFVDNTGSAEAFSNYYRVLNTDELNIPLSMNSISNTLDKVEIEQIDYWRPKTIGEVIFNYWD